MKALLAPHSLTELSTTVSNTTLRSNAERLMTSRILEVAVCCSRVSASSRVRALTCACRSARVAAFGALLCLGFVVLAYCVFAGLRLIVRRRPTWRSRCADDRSLPHHGVRCDVLAKDERCLCGRNSLRFRVGLRWSRCSHEVVLRTGFIVPAPPHRS